MRLGILTIMALTLLSGCGAAENIAATQTRAVELSQIATLTAPTATATMRPTPSPTKPPRIPTFNPTTVQAKLHPTQAEGCEFMEQHAAHLGVAFDPQAPIAVTVDDLMRRQGIDPTINSGAAVFLRGVLQDHIRACLGR